MDCRVSMIIDEQENKNILDGVANSYNTVKFSKIVMDKEQNYFFAQEMWSVCANLLSSLHVDFNQKMRQYQSLFQRPEGGPLFFDNRESASAQLEEKTAIHLDELSYEQYTSKFYDNIGAKLQNTLEGLNEAYAACNQKPNNNNNLHFMTKCSFKDKESCWKDQLTSNLKFESFSQLFGEGLEVLMNFEKITSECPTELKPVPLSYNHANEL